VSDLYLTIDDSPSANFTVLCDYLKTNGIPAVFFVRGDQLSLYPEETVQAIKDGFVIANHSWSHHRASKLGADLAVKEVLKTQKLIEALYKKAGVALPGPYMRFPYMDAGLGGWPLPEAAFSADEQAEVEGAYATFYGNDMTRPNPARVQCFNEIQAALRAKGFRQMPFEGVQIEWCRTYARSDAVSTQGTFCHPDWYRYSRYKDAFSEEERSVERLNRNFDDFVVANPGAHVIVMHDKEEIWHDTKAMIDHMLKSGHTFLPIPV
jgi:peptidoglycan/xylan/chitin deacetylase (PgdA/CDA1 family)